VFNDLGSFELLGDHVNHLLTSWLSIVPLNELLSLDGNLLFLHFTEFETDSIRIHFSCQVFKTLLLKEYLASCNIEWQ
jgi:hypothetical protein